MPKSIVVVDDEKLVVFGICSLLSEQNSRYEIAAACNSGEEGLKFCIEKKPDLLLTDIGMPGMDGLKLIERVRRTNPCMKIAVLSCHDEYNLVHKAFMLGADDYILKKDIDKNMLFQLLGRLLPEAADDAHAAKEISLIEPLSEEHDFTPEKPGSLGIIGFKCEESEGRLWQPDIPMLHQLINDEIHPHGKFYMGFRKDLVIFFPELDFNDKEHLNSLLTKTRKSVSKYINRKVFIAQYTMKPLESIIEAYNEGLKILDGLFYHNHSTVLTEKTTALGHNASLTFEITKGNFKTHWIETMDKFLKESEKNTVYPEAVKTELLYAIKHLLHNLERIGKYDLSSSITSEKILYYQKISGFDDLAKTKSWAEGFLGKIAEDLEKGKQVCSAVSNAMLYVSGNLHNDLRLNTVAELLGINPNHLSTVFKKTTGQNYIEFVNEKRIEHALELLETTDFSAKEIAYRCGYSNPNYFSRLFKKLTRTTISEYRCGHDNKCE